jgi:L-seryl-tRNA(Ser) seleniumtransferase
MRAVELYVEKDHDAEWADWEARVQTIVDAVAGIPSVEAEQFVPELANVVPHAGITWDPERIPLMRSDVAEALRDGEPRIEPRPGPADAPRLDIGVWMMQPGDHEVVAARIAEILSAAAA